MRKAKGQLELQILQNSVALTVDCFQSETVEALAGEWLIPQLVHEYIAAFHDADRSDNSEAL